VATRKLTTAKRQLRRDPVRDDVPLRRWTILAHDPSILGTHGRALTTQVTVPAERLEPGPKGHRVHVVDFDASSNRAYKVRMVDVEEDAFANISDIEKLVSRPYFHQQNAYAITMATLGEFEAALGRTVGWGFEHPGHQLKVAPHAFAEANAFYSRQSESLSFGYFPGADEETVFTCLAHDIVAHEATHAILDGLRSNYMRPSSPDQGGFHEGFADVVALLSVFKSIELVTLSLAPVTDRDERIKSKDLQWKSLANNVIMKLAKQMGQELSHVRGQPLRHSVELEPSPIWYRSDIEYVEPHKRGEILVAVLMHAFLDLWGTRLDLLGRNRNLSINRQVVAEEGATAASHLLKVAIRALDYMTPIDMSYRDYLSALLTSDAQLYPDDTRYGYRDLLVKWFRKYGIEPADGSRPDGAWQPPPVEQFSLSGTHFERMQRDPDAVFRFIWENRLALGIERDAFTRVFSVRPVVRVSNDHCILRETVVEYIQTLKVFASELKSLGIRKPDGLSTSTLVTLYGGGTLIFDEYGRLKFHVGSGVRSKLQSGRLQSLYERGYFRREQVATASFAQLHRLRATARITDPTEQW
jgi:hypothetical protein